VKKTLKTSLLRTLVLGTLSISAALYGCGGGGSSSAPSAAAGTGGATVNGSSGGTAGTSTGSPGNTGGETANGSTGCTPTLAAAESIALFPADNPWNSDISQAAVDARSAAIMALLAQSTSSGIFTDFGSGTYYGAPIGIPYRVVCGDQPKVPVVYRANGYDGNYGSESDPGPFPIPLDAPIEGNGVGDSHVITVDVQNKKLYELYNASLEAGGTAWGASSGALFDLSSNALRPMCHTSADAAGLPIFAGLVRYEEVAGGTIDHALRFTLPKSVVSPSFTAPARHRVFGSNTDPATPVPMGMRLRLKSAVDISGYSKTNQVILTAMKRHGIILADIGSSFYLSGAPDARWNNDDLRRLRAIKPSDFEVVQMGTIVDPSLPADRMLCAP